MAALDKHVIGQARAKKAVAIAVRDRWRRTQLSPALQQEVTPMNILMVSVWLMLWRMLSRRVIAGERLPVARQVGPTGTGKTEVARRLAKVSDAPFVKVVATK